MRKLFPALLVCFITGFLVASAAYSQMPFQQSKEDLSEADKHFEKGFELNNRGQYKESIAEFEKALQLEPDHLRANVYFGVAIMGDERFEDAIPQLEKALAIDKTYPLTNYALAVCYARKPEPNVSGAREYLDKAKQYGYRVVPWFEQYVEKLESGGLPASRQTTETAAPIDATVTARPE
ncbi:MAG: hypothetical protein P9M03_10755 [Candidatus Theseobacter exili]|nr:hypothetical protein [Candidatus Theseobacter exili]